MSYISDVRIITSKKGFEKLREYSKEIYNRLKPNNDGVYDIIEDCGDVVTGENFVELNFTDVKWYKTFPDVQSIEEALDKINEEGYGYSYGRVGEDYNDIETRYVEGTEKFKDDYYLPYVEIYTGFYDNKEEL